MKKFILLLISFYLYAYTPICNTFGDVLQTRDVNSKIIPKNGASSYLYNSKCILNTTSVENNQNNNSVIFCNADIAKASTKRGTELTDLNYTFSIVEANTAFQPTNSIVNVRVNSNNQNLSNSEYNRIYQNWWNYSFQLTFNGDKKINLFDAILHNVTIKNVTNHNVEIGSFTTKSYSDTTLQLDGVAKNIKIDLLQTNGSNDFTTNLEASETIQIKNLKLYSSREEKIVLKAPKVVITNLQSNNDKTDIEIYADEVDIKYISLGEDNKIYFHSYSSDKNVTFHSDSISCSSSSTLILDSGDYYINSISIPSSSSSTALKAFDSNQIVNVYINGDFQATNNPIINAEGSKNFGTLPALNFRLFINGDLTTGSGGTTFNALIYVEGETDLGSETYIQGALSSGGDISIGNNSKFYYDKNLEDNKLGECPTLKFDNRYSCNIFTSVLNSYSQIVTQNNQIFGTCHLDVKSKNLSDGGISCYNCSCSGENCNSDLSCKIEESPKNNYSHKMLETNLTTTQTYHNDIVLSNRKNGNYIFDNSNQKISFVPTNSYDDNPTKLMLFKDVSFNNNYQTLNIAEGDYYFTNFIVNGDNFTICPKGNVRIFTNSFVLNGDNIKIMKHNNECSGQIFIYSTGDVTIGKESGGNNEIHLFIYSKGDINIKNNFEKSKLYGAYTAEGDLILSDNVDFYFDDSGLDEFGLGKCDLCYDENYVSSNGFQMFNFQFCSFITPCIFDMPIKNTSGENLNSVKVIESYKHNNKISINFLKMKMDTIDKNGNHIGNGAHQEGNTDYSLFFTSISLQPKSIIYDFGNNYPDYTKNGDYYRAYKKSTFSFSFSKPEDLFKQWRDEVTYLAKYKKGSKDYSIVISACPVINEESEPIGFIDAWDNYKSSRGVNDRNISTKIVKKPFQIIVAFIPMRKVNTNSATIKYYLVAGNQKISNDNYLHIITNHLTTKTTNYLVNKAYKDVKVEFKVCANYDKNSGYQLYDYSNCSIVGDCSSNTEEGKVCYRTFQSSDSFAIRPDRFDIVGTGVNRAENNISFLTIKALDYSLTPTQNYDENSSTINLIPIDSKCSVSKVSYLLNFKDGKGIINYIKYPEVGEIELNISEKNGQEFAIIDKDDTDDKDRFIKSVTSAKFAIIPDHFKIENVVVSNVNGGEFTYLSRDLNMSGNVTAVVKAENFNNQVTKNYNKNCYAKKINVEISHSSNTPMNNLNYILTQYGRNDKDKNISFIIDETNFQNGIVNLDIKINFDRNSSKPVKPFILTLNKISVTDDNNTKGNLDIFSQINYFYGIIRNDDIVTDNNVAVSNNVFYIFNGDWIKNKKHTSEIYGYISGYYSNSDVDVSLNKTTLNSEQNLTIIPKISRRPYKVRLHLFVPSWLWYSKIGYEYQKPSLTNQNCLTHPCVGVLFLKQPGKNWGGAGTNETENNVSKNTIDLDIKRKKTKYMKITW